MANILFRKSNSLPAPGSLVANTLYIVKNGNSVLAYITDSSATAAYPLSSELSLHPFLFSRS